MKLQYRCALAFATVLLITSCAFDEPPPKAAEPLNAQEREWLAQYAKNKNVATPQERELLSAQRREQTPEKAPAPVEREVRALITKMPGGMKLSPANATSRDVVQTQVNAVVGSFGRCYEQELRNDNTLAGKVTLAWNITSKGKVTGVRIVESTLPSETVEACLMREATAMKFPKGKTVAVEYPFQFSALGN